MLIPNLNGKENVTQLDVILEAIKYIDSLEDTLSKRKENINNLNQLKSQKSEPSLKEEEKDERFGLV